MRWKALLGGALIALVTWGGSVGCSSDDTSKGSDPAASPSGDPADGQAGSGADPNGPDDSATGGAMDSGMMTDPPATTDAGTVDGGQDGGQDSGTDSGTEPDELSDSGAAPLPPLKLPPEPATDALRELPMEIAAATCEALEACLRPALMESLVGGDCVEALTAQIEDGEFRYAQASINDHRLVHDDAALEACTDDLAALGCDVRAARLPASCEALLAGQVPLGEECVIDDDCEGAAFCDRSTGCPGVCSMPGASGADCDSAIQCQDGLVCFEGSCDAPRAVGQSCGRNFGRCRLGAVCAGADAAAGSPGSCVDQDVAFTLGDGAICDPGLGQFCGDGSACVVDTGEVDGQPALIAVCKLRARSAGTCHMPIAPEHCPPGEYCPVDLNPDYMASCVPKPTAGEPCGVRDVCADGHLCNADDVCQKLGRIGERCSSARHCYSQVCDGKRCVPPARCAGEARSYCGDATCDADEACDACVADCGACPTCGDDSCNGDETCSSCAADCGPCAPVCGDDSCNGDETCSSCTADCGMCPPVCGDDSCNGDETCSSCEADCGLCPAACGDDRCDPDETCQNCAGDCGACGDACGDQACGVSESCQSCTADCGVCPPRCGDSVCQDSEDCSACEADCGACPWPQEPGEDLDDLPGELASGICQAFDDCLEAPLEEILLGTGDCVARVAADLQDGELIYLQDSIDAGRIAHDPSKLAACKAELSALACDLPLSRWPSSCDEMLDGQVPLGGGCIIDDDCAGESYCDLAQSCSGTCATRLGAGAGCSSDGQCATGMLCSEGTCTVPLMDGESCGAGVGPCRFGMLCIGADASMGQAGTCMTQAQMLVGAANDPCDVGTGQFCQDGLACVVDVVNNAVVAVCKPRVASGQPCNLALLPEHCPIGEYCPADLPSYQSSCAPRPALGQPCGVRNTCAADLYCDAQGVCRAGGRIGDGCSNAGTCYSERCADGVCSAPDRCRVPPIDVCDNGVCTPGESCADCPGDCGICAGVCGDGTCSADEDCGSCADDCGACPTHCGDGSCNGDETCDSCARDCGSCDGCGDAQCEGGETCESCEADCGACPTCGDQACNGDETCESCAADCGECAPVCDDGACTGDETCESCAADCGACPSICGDDSCDADETCASCAADCGSCPAPYSGPCDDDAECAPGHSCAMKTVDGLLGFPDVHYGYCAEPCSDAAQCSGLERIRSCTPDGQCARRCDAFIGLLDPAYLCPFGGTCLEGICTWQR